MPKIYLDNAATTPMSDEVIQSMIAIMQNTYGNPSSTHQLGRSAKAKVEQSRKQIAKHFKVTASEIVFTAGGSEADNLIITNAIFNLGVKRIITSKIEHHAVLHTIENLQKEQNIQVDYVNLTDTGEIDYKHLEQLLANSDVKTLVSLMYINNELGTILDIALVSQLCQEHKALFHSDTVQGIAHFKIDLQKTPIDFIAASAHKFHGPKGVGFAIVKKGFGIKPILLGGEQERGARAGTENVPSIIGMEKALTLMLNNLAEEQKYIEELKQYFIQLLKNNIPNVKFNGVSTDFQKSSYVVLSVRFPKEISMLLFSLDLKGIAVSGGSACQSGSNKGSHVLNAVLTEEEALKTSVRFSFSKYNTREELDYVIEVLKNLIN
jgi:cysteine desulfurase